MLGQGTFGQVVKCYCEETGELLAVKVIKNQDAFFQQVNTEQSLFLIPFDPVAETESFKSTAMSKP